VRPPTEQLIRDYLNRLSVAARGRLSAEDRRALITRTHEFIERKASVSGPANPMQVAALLSRLGDPGALVDQEVARLAALRGEPPVPPAEFASRLHGLRRRRQGQASWHWPRAAGSQDMQRRLLNGAAAGPDAVTATRTSGGAPPFWIPQQPSSPDTLSAGNAVPPEGTTADSEAASGAPPAGAGDASDVRPAEPAPVTSPVRPSWPSVVVRRTSSAAFDVAGVGGAPEPDDVSGPRAWAAIVQSATRLAAIAVGLARRSPVEAAAVVLLGLGGAIYPPVWLVGAVMALAHQSKVWDYRDKWLGVATPVLLLVVGTALAVTLGNHYPKMGGYVHEGWVYADVLSRIVAFLGACYLLWRLVHGKPRPVVPPWNRPHKVD
jgi:hypothetical protein